MLKLKLKLFSYRLSLNLRVQKGRTFSWKNYARSVRRRIQTTEPREIRLFARRIFAHKSVRKVLGTNLAVMVIATSFVPTHGLANVQAEEPVITENEAVLKTERAAQYPVDPIRITQGFRFYHPGIDLDGITGDPIRPVKRGRVAGIDHSKFNYGNSILIQHENGVTSLYAHLSEIDVEPDQEVTTDTVIGKMGATGRAFGDHLHLEIYDHGRAVNPTVVLPR